MWSARVCVGGRVCARACANREAREKRGRSYKMFLPVLYTFAYRACKKGSVRNPNCVPSFMWCWMIEL